MKPNDLSLPSTTPENTDWLATARERLTGPVREINLIPRGQRLDSESVTRGFLTPDQFSGMFAEQTVVPPSVGLIVDINRKETMLTGFDDTASDPVGGWGQWTHSSGTKFVAFGLTRTHHTDESGAASAAWLRTGAVRILFDVNDLHDREILLGLLDTGCLTVIASESWKPETNDPLMLVGVFFSEEDLAREIVGACNPS